MILTDCYALRALAILSYYFNSLFYYIIFAIGYQIFLTAV